MQRKQQDHRRRKKKLQNMMTPRIQRKKLHRNSSIQASSHFLPENRKPPWMSNSLVLLR
jgi:hypothetical protein